MSEETAATTGADVGATENQLTNQEGQEQAKPEETKTYTQEELNKLLQSETDKRVSDALKKSQSKWEKEWSEKLEKEKSEAEKLAKMSAEERAKAEAERAQAEFLDEKKKFEEERQQYQREKLELETTKELATRGLPTEFASFLLGQDADETKSNLDDFEKFFKAQVQKGVEDRLKTKEAPKSGQVGSSSKDPFLAGFTS